jgi:hypothetical protein
MELGVASITQEKKNGEKEIWIIYSFIYFFVPNIVPTH